MDNKKKLILIVTVALIIILVGSLVIFNKASNAREFKDQIELGHKYLKEGKYEEAILAFNKAIEIEPKNIEARFGLADAYVATNKLNEATRVLKEVIQLDKANKDAYIKLIDVYKKTGDTSNRIKDLLNDAKYYTDDSIFDDINKSLPKSPQASLQSGTYKGPQTVEFNDLKSGETIYYTLDGSKPNKNSMKYIDGIKIDKESVELRAITINYDSYESEESIYRYEVYILDPPEASVKSGEYDKEQEVSFINIPEGNVAYYTLDNTEPTDKSIKYTGSISIGFGNTVLRAIIVNKKGINSAGSKYEYRIAKKIKANIEDGVYNANIHSACIKDTVGVLDVSLYENYYPDREYANKIWNSSERLNIEEIYFKRNYPVVNYRNNKKVSIQDLCTQYNLNYKDYGLFQCDGQSIAVNKGRMNIGVDNKCEFETDKLRGDYSKVNVTSVSELIEKLNNGTISKSPLNIILTIKNGEIVKFENIYHP